MHKKFWLKGTKVNDSAKIMIELKQ